MKRRGEGVKRASTRSQKHGFERPISGLQYRPRPPFASLAAGHDLGLSQ